MQDKLFVNQKVAIFVDVQNMYYGAKKFRKAKLDFVALLEKSLRGRVLKRALAYLIENPELEQEKFFEKLVLSGYELRLKSLKQRVDGTMKGDWDMGLAIDAISIAEKVDVIVIVSGDGDFTDLARYLKSRGVLVEVVSFEENTSQDLIEVADIYTKIDKSYLL